MPASEDIEKFFLINLLRISLAGTSLILLTDTFYAQDSLSITIDAIIVSACLLAFLVRRWSYNAAVLIITGITLTAMLYQWINGVNLVTAMAVIMLLGFIFSILLKGKLMWIMHGLTCTSVVVAAIARQLQGGDGSSSWGEQATVVITHFVLYFIVSYCTAILKSRYDKINQELWQANQELADKASEIEAQHEELLQSHENVNELNRNLERLVMERTAKVQAQNEILLKYTYTNAHHLRGPVARLLGLITIHKLEPNPDYNFFFSKMEDQAMEIDQVVKQINSELEEKPS